jgi:hypothetical protein
LESAAYNKASENIVCEFTIFYVSACVPVDVDTRLKALVGKLPFVKLIDYTGPVEKFTKSGIQVRANRKSKITAVELHTVFLLCV